MKTAFQILIILLILNSCKNEILKEYDNYEVNENLKFDSAFHNFKEYQNINIGMNQKFLFYSIIKSFSDNYKPNAKLKNDTLNIEINNYNGNFGNGILIRIFDNKFLVKSIDPNVIKGIKFEKYKLISQKLILDQNKFKISDRLNGRIEFECEIPEVKIKEMSGFFRLKITE